MMKKKLGVLFAGILFFAFPILIVKADDPQYSLELRCENTTLSPQQYTTCTVLVDAISARVVGFDGTVLITEEDGVTESSKLVLSNLSYNHTNWDGDFNKIENNNSYMLTRSEESEPLTGMIEVATFQITAGHATGTAKVLLKNVKVGHQPLDFNESAYELVNPNSAQTTITISVQENNENSNPNINTNTNQDTNTNDNTNANDTSSDASKTNEKVPDNPGTGVTISLLGVGALFVGGISYVVLRKKNYFNRI